jgi:DNA polymerase III epsilon subunit-like protein
MFITVLDTETTGLDENKHELIQLGIVELELKESGELRVIKEHDYKFHPKHLDKADPESLKINGYSAERWSKAENDFSSVIPLLDDLWLKSDFLLGQNLIFDLRFITKSYHRVGLMRPEYPKYIDTKHMGSNLVSEGLLKSTSMDSMCNFFKIRFKGSAHDALVDCRRTIDVWQQLQKYTNETYFTFKEPYDPYANKNA